VDNARRTCNKDMWTCAVSSYTDRSVINCNRSRHVRIICTHVENESLFHKTFLRRGNKMGLSPT
jgi:hypothetical protein